MPAVNKAESGRLKFTPAIIDNLPLPEGVGTQSFAWDADVPGFGVRLASGGRRSYIVQARIKGAKSQSRLSIAEVGAITLQQARQRARELILQMGAGIDPREVVREAEKERVQVAAVKKVQGITFATAYEDYLERGKPKKKAAWSARYKADLKAAIAHPEGRKPGAFVPLLEKTLADLDADGIQLWYESEAKRGGEHAKRALMMLRGFLRWAESRPEYRKAVDRSAAAGSAITDQLPAAKRRTDALQLSQLKAFMKALGENTDKVGARLVATLLLTGARRESLAALPRSHFNVKLQQITFANKGGGSRIVPIGPQLAKALEALVEDNPGSDFLFPGTGKRKHYTEPRFPLEAALASAELPHVTVHGLRRSFLTISEEAGVPEGAAKQIAGHSNKTSVHEGYKVRSLDSLARYMVNIEKTILKHAGRRSLI